MKKNTKRGIILTSLATIAFAGSLLAGSTYALFTSESKNSIVVQSGKVDVKATVSDLVTYSGKNLTGNVREDESNINATTVNGTFTNGGKAEISEDKGTLSLSGVTPGDKVTFKINISNNSTVSAKYRTVFDCEENGGLYTGLSFDVTEASESNENSEWEPFSVWKSLETSDKSKTLNCVVELPSDAGNTYQGKSCTISFKVEAVQGNSATRDYVVIKNSDQIKPTIKDNMDIYFAPGSYNDYSLTINSKNVSLIGCSGAKFNNLSINTNDTVSKADSKLLLDGLIIEKKLDVNITDKEFEAKNCKVSQIFAKAYTTSNIDVKFTNNTFYRSEEYEFVKDTFEAPKNGGIFFCPQTSYSLTVTGNSFENYIGHAMRVQGDKNENHGATSIVVKNNNFISFGYDRTNTTELTSDDEAAFKIYSEATYAPKDGALDETTDADLIKKQKELSKDIYENNTFGEIVLNHGKFYTTNFYGVCYDQLTK